MIVVMKPYFLLIIAALGVINASALSQEYGKPDRDQPGDAMIQAYLRQQAEQIHQTFADDLRSPEEWKSRLPRYREEYLYMLGLWPLPEKTPLKAAVTGTLEGDGFVVEMLHYQSRPGLYVTGNLYRPREIKAGQRLPAVFYVCGHSGRGRNGNKTAFQSHGMWFARHGYVCLLVDTLQLGEIAAIHHGTYREGRWWWHSRGYTPAGVECWNGMRGIDYLLSRDDVDPQRIAVTGISGGGAGTFWIAAADERVSVAVPVSGMADLPSYVSNRVINGHCDCMFLYNTFQWPWTRIASLVAPRPMLFVNSDQDAIFPMDANHRVINRLERVYSLFGAGDQVDAVVSIGGHAYREDIRQAAYRFINTHLLDDPKLVTDSEVDLVSEVQSNPPHIIPPERLRVFPTDADLPVDELNTTIDEHFVPLAKTTPPAKDEFEQWKQNLLIELRRVVFRSLPERIPPGERVGDSTPPRLRTEPGIELTLRSPVEPLGADGRLVIAVTNLDDGDDSSAWLKSRISSSERVLVVDPRGVGPTQWTRKNPPNYVARSHVLLGTTVDTGRVRDVAAIARWVKQQTGKPVRVAGRGPAGLIAAYAAVLEPDIEGAVVVDPPRSHMDAAAPQFLNLLRVCDAPDMLGLLAPRPLTVVVSEGDQVWDRTASCYQAAGARQHFSRVSTAP
jgi:dienelactone hydrolase